MADTTTRADVYTQVVTTLQSYGKGTPNLYNIDGAVDEIIRQFGPVNIEGFHPITGRALVPDDDFWAILRRYAKDQPRSRTWWVTDTPLDDVDLAFFAERVAESGDPTVRAQARGGRLALSDEAADYFTDPRNTYAGTRRLTGGGYELSTPAGTVPLRKVDKEQDR